MSGSMLILQGVFKFGGLLYPYHPCMVYIYIHLHLVDFYGFNVGRYTIHRSYGVGSEQAKLLYFVEIQFE